MHKVVDDLQCAHTPSLARSVKPLHTNEGFIPRAPGPSPQEVVRPPGTHPPHHTFWGDGWSPRVYSSKVYLTPEWSSPGGQSIESTPKIPHSGCTIDLRGGFPPTISAGKPRGSWVDEGGIGGQESIHPIDMLSETITKVNGGPFLYKEVASGPVGSCEGYINLSVALVQHLVA